MELGAGGGDGTPLSASLPLPLPVAAASTPAPPVVSTLPSLNAPLFFEIVEDQVYLSNKCDASSFPFLATLQLNTVVYLSYDELSRELTEFFKERDISVVGVSRGTV